MTKQEFLAMSLPYGLKCKTLDIEVEDFDTMFYFQEFEANEKSIYNETYPYLHPLSYLTKDQDKEDSLFWRLEEFACNTRDAASMYDHSGLNDINWVQEPFEIVMWLIKEHFDIAGLIEKGEAIDVNTLPENPYK